MTDPALCRDLIHRLCLPERCEETDTALGTTDACEAQLLSNTGCGEEGFGFATPSRKRILECRLPIVRAGDGIQTHPACVDVADMVRDCSDVVGFLRGATP